MILSKMLAAVPQGIAASFHHYALQEEYRLDSKRMSALFEEFGGTILTVWRRLTH